MVGTGRGRRPAPPAFLKRSGLASALLALTSAFVGLAGLEFLFRLEAWWRYQHSLDRAILAPPPLGPDGKAKLVHLLRPSRDPRIVYELRPNLAVRIDMGTIESRVTTNSQGFRDREYSVEKAPRSYRIVGLGDSLMFGWGLQEGEDYLSLVETAANRDEPGTRWEVINTAVPGYYGEQ